MPYPGGSGPWSFSITIGQLIPALVANLDLAVLDTDGKSGRRFEGRWSQGFTCLDAEARAVARADDLVAFDRSTGEDATVVSANVLDGVVLTLEVEDGDLSAIDVNDLVGAGRKLSD
jgi:hypothetical protein